MSLMGKFLPISKFLLMGKFINAGLLLVNLGFSFFRNWNPRRILKNDFYKCFSTISKNNYWKVAAELVSDKEAYGGPQQALKIWLTLRIMKIENFLFLWNQYLNWLVLRSESNTNLWEFPVFYIVVRNDPADPRKINPIFPGYPTKG